ncbi:hypothetical protein PDJAM_G00157560 [Pangasius djambal]|uniref:Uncharacterized protein n=1 Tax=Pangasius djambal TaxID=1691987 RepID=A0ACC5ZIC6_9TELE|nr:hypothetical protein [Pangasius djambal]
MRLSQLQHDVPEFKGRPCQQECTEQKVFKNDIPWKIISGKFHIMFHKVEVRLQSH